MAGTDGIPENNDTPYANKASGLTQFCYTCISFMYGLWISYLSHKWCQFTCGHDDIRGLYKTFNTDIDLHTSCFCGGMNYWVVNTVLGSKTVWRTRGQRECPTWYCIPRQPIRRCTPDGQRDPTRGTTRANWATKPTAKHIQSDWIF